MTMNQQWRLARMPVEGWPTDGDFVLGRTELVRARLKIKRSPGQFIFLSTLINGEDVVVVLKKSVMFATVELSRR